ncbi:MFS transporter [Phycicoccus endophyticus]|uniref:MFS transporter n=1 Tax=Phycicoccus endophyticus TaxID=1690220 RepID=A0A7G9R1P0_9MICO|nr:MFS transporter [Phycicoccus endophyticus]NHI18694.1 MFS transporter [Phycicoccus endophyticus]QNN49515.1 MFS transporter [Phycicoccus endophyticus]GGL37176.1 MFS transporter [Phycicoccus endophyticus]
MDAQAAASRATGGLPPSARRGYGLGSVATGSFGTVPGLLLLPYLTDRLGVAAGVAGLVVFLPKAWDVLLNPVAGRVSDRSSHPGGRRRPFLLRAGILLAVAFVLLFSGPTAPTGIAAAWVVVLFLACATAYAFFQVPYVAMPAEMTDDYDERTRLMTWRVAVLALAILVSGGLSPVVRDALGPTWGYRGVGLFVGVLILVGTVGAWWGTRTAPTRRAATAGGSLADQLRVVGASQEFRALLAVFVLQALATGAMLAGVDYVARVLLGSTGASTVLFVCFVGPALLVTPLWQRLGERRGKRTGYLWGSLLLGAGALATLAATGLGTVATAVTVGVVGVGYAACQMFPLAMLPDVAAADTARTGEDRAGTYTGVWTAGETLGLALGPFLYAAVLAVGGYVSSTDAAAVQPDSARWAVALGFTVLPALLVATSLLLLRRYRLDPKVTP